MRFNRPVLGCLLASFLYLPAASWSGAYLNTFEPVATLSPQSETLTLVVKLGCDQGEKYRVRVTANQRNSGAVAEGFVAGICKGDPKGHSVQRIPVVAQLIGNARFEQGQGITASGLVTTTVTRKHRVEETDVHQWVPLFELSLQ